MFGCFGLSIRLCGALLHGLRSLRLALAEIVVLGRCFAFGRGFALLCRFRGGFLRWRACGGSVDADDGLGL